MQQGVFGYIESAFGETRAVNTFVHDDRTGSANARLDIYRSTICCLRNVTPRMNIMTNYSVDFGVVMRAVCPMASGFVGYRAARLMGQRAPVCFA